MGGILRRQMRLEDFYTVTTTVIEDVDYTGVIPVLKSVVVIEKHLPTIAGTLILKGIPLQIPGDIMLIVLGVTEVSGEKQRELPPEEWRSVGLEKGMISLSELPNLVKKMERDRR